MRTLRLFRLIARLLMVDVQFGALVPAFYGVAWFDPYRKKAVAMPIPLNLIAGPLRSAWFWSKCGAWRAWRSDQGQVCQRCGHSVARSTQQFGGK